MRVEINEYIVADREICGGTPTFKGTRIMVWQILEMLQYGETIDEILENYPSLTKEHIKAALGFAVQKLSNQKFTVID